MTISTQMTQDPDLDRLIDAWERQQHTYIPQRDARFEAILDTVEQLRPADDLVVLDLGTGPGSLADRVLDRFDAVTVVGVDYDPFLLRLAEHRLADRADRVVLRRLDLTTPEVLHELPVRPNVAVSTTALHWLTPPELTALFAVLADVLGPDGLYVNGDHLTDPTDPPVFTELYQRVNAASTERLRGGGALDWDQWWDAAADLGAWNDELETRHRWRAERPHVPDATLDHHLASLRSVGFDAATVWRHFDDVVVAAVRR